MAYKISFSEIAVEHIEQAITYYNETAPHATNKFKGQLNHALNVLEIWPFFQIKYEKIRALPLKSMPFIVMYSVDEKLRMVYVYAVFNTYQNPRKYP
jgi:hypothetical protein